MEFFRIARTQQTFTSRQLPDVEDACIEELEKLNLRSKIAKNDRVAVSLGSRGIKDIEKIARCVVTYLKDIGASPFIIPVMGSHGGGTAQGQVKVLAGYGITEEFTGAPIFSSMEVDKLGEVDGIPIYIDQYANNADHIFIINRVKAHTLFHGDIESGLLKMIVIGLGKHKGALAAHKQINPDIASEIIKKMSRLVLQQKENVFGVALVEDGYKNLAFIKALHGAEIEKEEPKILNLSKELLPKLPFDTLDLLILDEIGKEVSGSGMDPNVVGRMWNDPFGKPHIGRIFVRDLSEKTDGNATGIGRADFTTTRLVEKINRHFTYANCLTSMKPEGAKIPVYFDSDREVLENAIPTMYSRDPKSIKAIWIKNTSSLSEMFISEALVPLAKENKNLEVTGELLPLKFDDHGNLLKP
ncbi:MAG: hypothetical protein KGZ79_16520 [Dethiobacter sp.]|jgi:hypothetical protein|nr:hypothetical protein [Dethiobacter sp.]MBS4023995.1 hypothetical protein [Dethiobacter sp.]